MHIAVAVREVAGEEFVVEYPRSLQGPPVFWVLPVQKFDSLLEKEH